MVYNSAIKRKESLRYSRQMNAKCICQVKEARPKAIINVTFSKSQNYRDGKQISSYQVLNKSVVIRCLGEHSVGEDS